MYEATQEQARTFRRYAAQIEQEFAGPRGNVQGAVRFFERLTVEQLDAILPYLPAGGQLAKIAEQERERRS